jgi:hypothetical protein
MSPNLTYLVRYSKLQLLALNFKKENPDLHSDARSRAELNTNSCGSGSATLTVTECLTRRLKKDLNIFFRFLKFQREMYTKKANHSCLFEEKI